MERDGGDGAGGGRAAMDGVGGRDGDEWRRKGIAEVGWKARPPGPSSSLWSSPYTDRLLALPAPRAHTLRAPTHSPECLLHCGRSSAQLWLAPMVRVLKNSGSSCNQVLNDSLHPPYRRHGRHSQLRMRERAIREICHARGEAALWVSDFHRAAEFGQKLQSSPFKQQQHLSPCERTPEDTQHFRSNPTQDCATLKY